MTQLSNEWWAPPAVLASKLAPGALSQFLVPGLKPVVPQGVEPPGVVETFIPGMVSGAYGGIHGLGVVADHLSGGRVGWTLPGGERAQQLSAMSLGNANEVVNRVQPEITPNLADPAQRMAATVGEIVGPVLTPGGAIAKGPGAVGFLTRALLPGSVHTGKVAGVAGGVGLAADTLLGDIRAGEPTLQSAQPPDQASTPENTSEKLAPPVEWVDPPVEWKEPQAQAVSTQGKKVQDFLPKQRQAWPDHKAMLDHYADVIGVDKTLARTFIGQESNFNPNAVNSTTGATGLGQLMGPTAVGLGVTDRKDPEQNAIGSLLYMKEAIDKGATTVEQVARYYYGGPDQKQWGPITQNYARVIAARYNTQLTQAQAQIPPPVEIPLTDNTLPPDGGWSVWDAGKAALATAVIALGGKAGIRVARDLTALDAASIKARKDAVWHADRVQRDAGLSPDGSPPVAPLPGETPATRAEAAILDATAPVKHMTDEIASGDIAKAMRGKAGLTLNNMPLTAQIDEIMKTGVDDISGIRMPSMQRHVEKVAFAPEADARAYTRHWMIEDELDTRLEMMQRAIRAGDPISDPTQFRRNFFNMTDEQLRAERSLHASNPFVQEMTAEQKVINARFSEMLHNWGYVTNQGKDDILRVHPNYLASTDKEGRVVHSFGERDYRPWSGTENMDIPAHKVMAQHWYEVMKEGLRNRVKQDYFTKLYDAQNNDPSMARVIEPDRQPPVGTTPGDWIKDAPTRFAMPWRNNGVLEWHKINSPDLYYAFNQDPSTTGVFLGVANRAKNLLQNMTTGPMGYYFGNFFGVTQIPYSAGVASITRGKDLSASFLDAATKKLSGGRFGLPGDVVGHMGLQTYAIGADLAAKGAEAIAHMFSAGSGTVASRFLRMALGDQYVDAMAMKAADIYHRSVVHMMNAQGVNNAAGGAARDLPTTIEGAKVTRVFDPINASIPELTKIPILRQGQIVALNIHGVVKEIHDTLSNSSASAMMRLNSGMMPGMRWAKADLPPEALALQVRDLLGDPGKVGNNQLIRGARDTLPYANVSLQGTSRFLQAAKDNPLGTAVGVANVLGMGGLVTMVTAMNYGPAALEYLDTFMTNDQHSSDIVIFPSPGQPIENMTVIKVPQELRVFKPMIDFLIRAATQADKVARGEGTESFTEVIHQMMSKHISPDIGAQTLEGASSVLSISAPPAAQVIANLAGKTMRGLDLSQMVKGFPDPTAMLTKPLAGGSPAAPGIEEGDNSLTHDKHGLVMKGIIESVLGSAGAFIAKTWAHGNDQLAWGKGPWDVATHTLDLWKQNASDKTPVGNMLWGEGVELRKGTPLSDRVYTKLNALRPMMNIDTDVAFLGRTSQEGLPLSLPPGSSSVPTDPLKFQMWNAGARYAQVISDDLMPRVKEADLKIQEAERSGMSPQLIRAGKNEWVRKREEALSQIAGYLKVMEESMSKIAGRRVVVEDEDWGPRK